MIAAVAGQETGSLPYPLEKLCRLHSFEEVAYLLWHGDLPTREQLSTQNRAERAQRAIDPRLAATVADQPTTAHPLDTISATVQLLGENDPAGHGTTPEGLRAKALRLFAVLPTIIAMDQRRRQGLGAVAPRDHLGYAANFLSMIFGKVPEPQVVAAFETALKFYAWEGFRAAALSACAAAGFHNAIAAEIGALKESPRAGAGPAVMEMMNEIAIPDNAKPWLNEALVAGREIRGFGRPGDWDGDARVPVMRAALGMIAALRGGHLLLKVYDALAAATYTAGLRPSLDYPVGPAYHLIGFDSSAFAPIFAAACLPGWTAHVIARSAAPPA